MVHAGRPIALILLTVSFLLPATTQRVSTQSAGSFGITDLGDLVVPTALTDTGFPMLTGYRHLTSSVDMRAFFGAVGAFRTFGTLGGSNSIARATNGSIVVGESQTSSHVYHAFAADFRGNMTDLGTLGGSDSFAYGVNDEGVIVGGSSTTMAADGPTRAFIYRNGAMSALGATLGGTRSIAFDINNHDQVVGYASLPDNSQHRAFLFDGSTTTNLGSLGGSSIAYAINDAGVVVGSSMLAGTTDFHAFRWEGGVMQDLGTLGGPNSHAAAINGNGVIAGYAEIAPGRKRAVIWRDGVIYDLNNLIRPGSDWVLEEATGIGHRDAVVGWGRRSDGRLRGFMLTPPFDIALSVTAHENEQSTNFPRPHETGPLLLGVSVFNNGDFAPTGVVVRDTISGPIEYVSWDGDCVQEGQTLTCRIPPMENLGRDVMIQARTTGPGDITHAAEIIRSDHIDTHSANNVANEANTAVSLQSLTMPSRVTGGSRVLARATLTSPSPSGGARVRLSSSHPDVATVPDEFDVLPWSNGGLYRDFYVNTREVSAPVTVTIGGTYGLRTSTSALTVMPAGAAWPYGDTARVLPGLVQAEDFDEGGEGAGYHDLTRGNDGGAYRATDVDIQATTDAGGGYNVGWMNAGEWLGYTVHVQTAGTYRLDLRVASAVTGGRLRVEFDGVDKTGALAIPNTGGWQVWRDVSVDVTLAAGPQRMRVIVDGASSSGAGNLNYVRLTSTAPASTPYAGTPIALPGIVQAEDFDHGGAGVAYQDTTPGNAGGAYRTTDVDIQPTADAGGGYNVGWMAPGEWLAYTVNVASAGSHRLDIRVAANGDGGRFHIEFDGVDKTGPLTIPATGGWQSWYTVHANVTLDAGTQRMRIVVDGAGPTGVVGNINHVRVVSLSTTPTPTDIVIYAADVPNSSIFGSWSKATDSASPGGVKLQTTDAGVSHAGAPLASPVDYFEVSFQAAAGQPYAIWLRLKALGNSKWNDAVWVQFSGAHAGGTQVYPLGSTSGLLVNLATDSTGSSLQNWGWQNGAYWLTQHTTVTFPAGGTQRMRIQVREDGVQLDQIVLSPSAYRHGAPGGTSNDTVIVRKPLSPYP